MGRSTKSFFLCFVFFLFCAVGVSQTSQEISGSVTQMGQPLADVHIIVEELGAATSTDSQGRYQIETVEGSTLKFSYTGLNTVKIIIEDVTRILNVEMIAKAIMLDEVTVTKKRKSQVDLAKNYHSDRNIIKTAFSFVDTRSMGTRVSIMDHKELSKRSGGDFASLIAGLFAGSVVRSNSGPQFLSWTRTGRFGDYQLPIIFDIDGLVFTDFPWHVQVNDIERMAYVPGLSAVGRYGLRAGAGVVVINTKGNTFLYEKDSKTVYDFEKRRDNFYIDDTTRISRSAPPNYLEELLSATSEKAAINIYQNQQNIFKSLPYYHLNVSDYFLKVWNSKKEALAILDMIVSDFSNNPAVLKAVAYKYDELRELERSWETYRKILLLRTDYAQSYRDLANSFRQMGDVQSAIGLYTRYGVFSEISDKFGTLSGIDSLMLSEYKNLIAIEKDPILESKKSSVENEIWGVRVLVEWNNSESEFELQVIHPNTQYFTIDHTISGNSKRIEDEKTKGYGSEQIWFDYSDRGTWNINLNYLGNKSYDPTYFKITLYRNWGLPTQTKEIKVFRMDEENRKSNVLRFSMTPNNIQ